MGFWAVLLVIPEYKELTKQAKAMFVLMSTSYLCEQGFSALVLIKTKKTNAILHLDPLIQGELKIT